jgi:hypothetical protein
MLINWERLEKEVFPLSLSVVRIFIFQTAGLSADQGQVIGDDGISN